MPLSEAVTLDASTLTEPGPGTQTQAELQALRQEVARLQGTAATLRQQLAHTQQQMENTRQELEQRQHTAATERQQLAQARQELAQRQQTSDAAARDDTELKRLEAQLQQREAELVHQQQEVVRLQQERAQLEQEAGRHRAQLAALEQQRQQVELAGPTIEIVEPPVTRGIRNLAVMTIPNGTAQQRREIVGKVTSPAGVLTFTVNDQPEKLNEHGIFRVPISANNAGGSLNIVAVDQQGKRASMTLTLTSDASRSSAGLGPKRQAPAIEFGTYHALIIGNNAYTHWPHLKTPQNDATEMAALLDKKYGFKTKVLLNATRFDILQALNELRKTLTEADNLLVYYAGHGHFEKKIERGYWVPTDGHMDSDVNWIATFAVTDILSVVSAKHVLVVSDSCYSGALTRSALARLEEGMTEEAREHWLKATAAKRSRTVLASGGLQPVLDTGGGGHSVFAKAFLDVLTSNTDILEGQRLGSEVAARVSYAASAALVEQEPQYAPLRYAGHELGDFLFVPKTLE